MNSSQLNPSQHVERIREILIGRDLQHMHGRISRIENTLLKENPSPESPDFSETITSLRNEQASLRQELQTLKDEPPAPQTAAVGQIPQVSDDFADQLSARIDARFREVLSHVQNELLQLKGQLEEDLLLIQESKVDRIELASRFARLASAAMEEQDREDDDSKPIEGFLL